MTWPLVISVCACMAAGPMAPEVGGAPPGGVVVLSLLFPPLCNSSAVLVGGTGAAGVA